MIDPNKWLVIANERRPKLPETSEWIAGTIAPVHPGWYERYFTDSESIEDFSMQWWDGAHWRARPASIRHWRQVGDYPAWRGLAKAPQYFDDDKFALAA